MLSDGDVRCMTMSRAWLCQGHGYAILGAWHVECMNDHAECLTMLRAWLCRMHDCLSMLRASWLCWKHGYFAGGMAMSSASL